MKKVITVALSLLFFIYTVACSSGKMLDKNEPLEQESVRITLTDGSQMEGIVVKQTADELIYIDAKTHNKETVKAAAVQTISKSDYVYDFSGNPIPEAEIKKYKGSNKTLLYGSGGLLLGAAAGIGTGLIIVSADTNQTTLAQITAGAFMVTGAVVFGLMGADKDYQNAVHEARMARYEKEKVKIETEKKELEKLKKEKEELLKKKKAGKK